MGTFQQGLLSGTDVESVVSSGPERAVEGRGLPESLGLTRSGFGTFYTFLYWA